ncbi:MAG: STAS domain-containing protein [Pseudomonadota bacterium]|nr:STAS domain-containing protein [Pseudomonadota bacterium]MDE3037611.1 STAS domain-containing protein [Pseudomonadota bacterium]
MTMLADKFIPLSTALRETLSRGYSVKTFGQDALAALIVSMVALPLSMALAIAVGLPPQYGLYTAIVAGITVPLLGGSVTQVSGPTAAFVVILAPLVTQFGLRGIILAEMMAGVMLLMLAWARLGKFINFVPYPVSTGFTAAIAVVLGTLSLNDLLGLGVEKLQGSYIDKVILLASHVPGLRWPEACIGLLSLVIMFTGKRITSKVPSVVLGIGAGTLLAMIFQHTGISVATLGNQFSYEVGGITGHGIPPFPPSFHFFSSKGFFAWPTYLELKTLMMPAFVIAVLAALESLLSATVSDGMARTRHNPNAELAALGIGNILCGFASGIPATGAIARTTTNIKSGGKTPLASSMHAVLIMLYVLALAPVIDRIPMASLAALLVLTAYNMSHYRQFYRILTIAPRQDIIVLLVCFGLTVFIDMVAGVSVGIGLAALLFIQRMSAITEGQVHETIEAGSLPPNVLLYRISGPLFFATVERTLDRTAFLRNHIDTLIFDLREVPLIDMTGLVALKNLLTGDALSGKKVVLCGRPDILHKIMQKLASEKQINVRMAASVEEALAGLTPTASAV